MAQWRTSTFALEIRHGCPQTLPLQQRERALGNAEPTTVLRSVVPLDLGGDVARLLRLLELAEGRGVMHIQVVHDQDDLLDVRVHLVDQLALRIASYASARIIVPGTA
jgi:hypothetical protein